MSLILRCTDGPAAGDDIAVDSELVLGRDQPEPGRLRGDPQLSREHARIYLDDRGRPVVEDLGSTNGTFVNESRLTESRVLQSGDRLRAGKTSFEVEFRVETGGGRTEVVETAGASTTSVTSGGGPALLVLSGPKQGEEIQLAGELLIGRGYGEPGALGGDRKLSRHHARIARGPGGVFFIEDTGSTNGTVLNSEPLRRARALKDGDEIELGSCKLKAHGFPRAPNIDDDITAAPVLDPDQTQPGRRARPAAPSPGGRLSGPLVAPPREPPSGGPPFGGPPGVPPGVGAPAPGAGGSAPGFDAPAGLFVPQGAAGTRMSSHRVVGAFVAVFVLAAVAAVAVVVLAAPLGSRACPQGFVCHKPPRGQPLRDLATFTGAMGWRVEYDSQDVKKVEVTDQNNEIVLGETAAEDSILGAPANSGLIAVLIRAFPSSTLPSSAVQSVASTISTHLVGASTAPNSDQLFGVPAVGFHPGVGEVLEGDQRTPQGPGGLEKLAVMAATSSKLTMVVAVVYPVQRGQSQGTNPNQPFDQFGDQIIETVRFPSDGDL
jgi:pSer/pThr/pTyr-binding forkhead associated (FHA) protein